ILVYLDAFPTRRSSDLTNLQVGGTYFVKLKAGALDKLHDANPDYTFNNPGQADLTVTPRDITITADNSSKVYGNADPTKFNLTRSEEHTSELQSRFDLV